MKKGEHKKAIRHPLYLAVVLPVSLFFFVAAWSPPFCYETLKEWAMSWQVQVYASLCHQQINRILHLFGMPLAVCSRCAGIYSGLFIGLGLFFFFFQYINRFKSYIVPIFFVISFFMVIDVFLNFFQIWNSTHVVRLVTGILWGGSTASLLALSLEITNNKNKGEQA